MDYYKLGQTSCPWLLFFLSFSSHLLPRSNYIPVDLTLLSVSKVPSFLHQNMISKTILAASLAVSGSIAKPMVIEPRAVGNFPRILDYMHLADPLLLRVFIGPNRISWCPWFRLSSSSRMDSKHRERFSLRRIFPRWPNRLPIKRRGPLPRPTQGRP